MPFQLLLPSALGMVLLNKAKSQCPAKKSGEGHICWLYHEDNKKQAFPVSTIYEGCSLLNLPQTMQQR